MSCLGRYVLRTNGRYLSGLRNIGYGQETLGFQGFHPEKVQNSLDLYNALFNIGNCTYCSSPLHFLTYVECQKYGPKIIHFLNFLFTKSIVYRLLHLLDSSLGHGIMMPEMST